MSYTPVTDFAAKDNYPSGDPRRAVTGGELALEFEAIKAELAAKLDSLGAYGSPLLINPPTAQGVSKGWGQTTTTLTDAATITIDAALSNNFKVTVAGSRTLAFPTNLKAGQEIIIAFTTSGTNRTITFASGWYKPSGSTYQLNAADAKVAVLRARANHDATKLFILSFYNDYVAA